MRVLITCLGGAGHLFPMITTGWALRAAGHEVLLATAGSDGLVAGTGLPSAAIAPGLDLDQLKKDGKRAFRSSKDNVDMTGDLSEHPAVRFFAGLADGMADGLVELALSWRPDLVVHEPMLPIGTLAAVKAGVPAVGLGLGIAYDEARVAPFFTPQLPIFQRFGLDELPVTDALIDVSPPSMGSHDGAWPMRYVPYNGGGVLPDWLLRDAQRLRITVTLGTVAPDTTGLGPVERVIQAAGRIDAEFVLAMGNADTETLGELPDNVRISGWVPLNALLATSSAVIHHGGAGTTMTALDAGLPQLVVPQGADQPANAAAVVKRGAGLSAEDDEVDAALIGRLLDDAKLRSTAAAVQAEIRAMPVPAAVVPRLVELAS
jgi:UDP:flavonoid glycosyltransferase YjiC (YdhE family)